MIKNKITISILFLAVLLIGTVFMPVVGATDNKTGTARNNTSDNSLAE